MQALLEEKMVAWNSWLQILGLIEMGPDFWDKTEETLSKGRQKEGVVVEEEDIPVGGVDAWKCMAWRNKEEFCATGSESPMTSSRWGG